MIVDIRKKPNFRSSRIYIPIIATPIMTSNYVKVNKEDPHIVLDADPSEETHNLYNYVKVDASGYVEGNEPYRAFQQNEQGVGWMCPIVDGQDQWISLDPGLNWRIPNEGQRFHISKIEVINRFFDDEMCKQFAFQGRRGILDWETIRVCKIQKLTAYYKSTYEIEYEDYYDEFRLLIQVPAGKTNVGFATINMYFFASDHDEVTYEYLTAKGITFPRLIEKLFVQNDDADGIVWEKKHDNTMYVAITSWYPGFYSSTSFATTIAHPHDRFYREEGSKWVEYNNGPYIGQNNKVGGEQIARTKNYVVCMTGSYYYWSHNVYQWTVNGKDWCRPYSDGVPVAFFQGGRAGFGIKNDIGLIFHDGKAKGLELQADGKIKIHVYAECSGGTVVGDVATIGTYVGAHLLNYFRFIDNEGNIYDSPLQSNYEYTDLRESDPAKRVKKVDCGWKFGYGEGKYYAAARHTTLVYYNEVKKQWQSSLKFVMLVSTDGFRTYTVAKELDPCPEWRYASFGYALKDGGIKLVEQWRELDDNLNITNYYHTAIGDAEHDDYVDVPLIGFNSDSAYRKVRVRFSNRIDTGGDDTIRLLDFGVDSSDRVAYIEKGKPACPKYYCIPTAFKKNYWSSNSYDEGGFVFFDGDGENFAYGTSNYMIDRHNYTYQNIIN